MVSKAHGSASASQVLTGNLQFYTVWCESPNAVSDPDNATEINILITGNIADVAYDDDSYCTIFSADLERIDTEDDDDCR